MADSVAQCLRIGDTERLNACGASTSSSSALTFDTAAAEGRRALGAVFERLGLPRFQVSKFGPEDYFANHSNDNVDGFSSDRAAIYAWHKEAAWKRKEYLSLCADLKRGTRKRHDDAKFFTLFENQRNAEKTLQSEFPDGRFRLHNRVNHVLCALDAAKETCLRGDATLQSLFCPLQCDRAIPHGYECLLVVYDDIRGGSDFTRLSLQDMKRALHGIYESKANGIHNGKSDLLKAWAAMWTFFKNALTKARRGDCCDEDEQQDDEDQSLASQYLLKSNKREREPVPGNADDSEDEAVLRHRLHLDASFPKKTSSKQTSMTPPEIQFSLCLLLQG